MILTIPQIYAAWIQVGGNTGDLAVYMTAIALAESGGDTMAVSPSDDHGVWQINSVHAASFPHLWPKRYDPIANARMAKAISGNGTNIGPWCTIWRDPARNCGHYHAPPPEAGSPAGDNVSHVATVIGSAHIPVLSHPATISGPPKTPGDRGWSHWQRLLGDRGKAWDDQIQADHHVMRGRH